MKHLACQYPTKQPWKRADDGEHIHTQTAENPTSDASGDAGSHPPSQTPDLDVTKVWNACRFVRMGWITTREALLLVDRFFSRVAPQSPVLTSFYAAPSSHYWLITQEPMLCCVILLISSQFHHPPGIGGKSRGYFIHHRLFQHCQHLILRIMLGQEKLSKAKTRHIGTIEALLLLSEWCPQSLHFPPETDGWDADLILTMPDERDPPIMTDEDDKEEGPFMSGKWKEDVVEPTRRSDRMSWMLLNSALALAHELGVFDDPKQPRRTKGHDGIGPDAKVYVQHLEVRRQRLPSLLFVFVNGLASRIGFTSPMPEPPGILLPSGVNPAWEGLMASWIDLIQLTKGLTTQFLTQGQEWDMASLDGWREQLLQWKERNHNCEYGSSTYTKQTDLILILPSDLPNLQIEYQYIRVFTNSLGIQAIIEQVLSRPTPSQTTDATFISLARQANLTTSQYEYIEEVIEGSGEILSHIIQSNQRPLQYLPIRVVHPVISSSIFFIKALALGVPTAKLYKSLDLLEKALAAFKSPSLDDVHLISRYATLLQVHGSRLRQTFDRVDLSQQQQQQQEQNEALYEGFPSSPIVDWSSDWLSLPLDPLMAPFGEWDGAQESGLDEAFWDLDFIWNLPPS